MREKDISIEVVHRALDIVLEREDQLIKIAKKNLHLFKDVNNIFASVTALPSWLPASVHEIFGHQTFVDAVQLNKLKFDVESYILYFLINRDINNTLWFALTLPGEDTIVKVLGIENNGVIKVDTIVPHLEINGKPCIYFNKANIHVSRTTLTSVHVKFNPYIMTLRFGISDNKLAFDANYVTSGRAIANHYYNDSIGTLSPIEVKELFETLSGDTRATYDIIMGEDNSTSAKITKTLIINDDGSFNFEYNMVNNDGVICSLEIDEEITAEMNKCRQRHDIKHDAMYMVRKSTDGVDVHCIKTRISGEVENPWICLRLTNRDVQQTKPYLDIKKLLMSKSSGVWVTVDYYQVA